MTRKQRFEFCTSFFQQTLPDAETELHFSNPYELLVAVILSAQCTDKRVNLTTPSLFHRFPNIESLAEAEYEQVFELIKSISFPGNKSRHLIGMAKLVRDVHKGQIPLTVSELVKLPGVGRKTANVITSVVDKQPNMAVDTHVFRVSARIGLTRGAKTPLQAELQLVKYIPKNLIYIFHHWLILHGRYVCVARKPLCEKCGLRPACKYFQSLKAADLPGL